VYRFYPTFSRFDRTPTCDEQTDGHSTTAYIVLALRRAMKVGASMFKLLVKISN